MRDLKFRGRRFDGTWVYGYYVQRGQEAFIFDEHGNEHLVKRETVGQYTGHKSKSGVEILAFADPIAEEYRWFAWYPVPTADRGWRWMQLVYKRKYCPHSYLSIPIGTFFMYAVDGGVLS